MTTTTPTTTTTGNHLISADSIFARAYSTSIESNRDVHHITIRDNTIGRGFSETPPVT